MWIYLMPQNCSFKKDWDGKFYVIYVLPQLKKRNKTRNSKNVKAA